MTENVYGPTRQKVHKHGFFLLCYRRSQNCLHLKEKKTNSSQQADAFSVQVDPNA